MENKDNRMDEFFKNSMEQFDKKPSSNVWSNIASELDSELTFFQKMWMYSRNILPYLIFLLFFGGYFLYANNQINSLKNELSSFESKTAESHSLQSAKTKIIELESTINELKILLAEAQSEVEELKIEMKRNSTKGQFVSTTSQQLKIDRLTTEINRLSKINSSLRNDLNSYVNIGKNTSAAGQLKSQNQLINNAKTRKNVAISTLDCHKPNNYLQHQYFLPGVSSILRVVDESKTEKNGIKSRYLVGFTGSAFNTFISKSDNYNFGTNFGLRQEYSIFQEFSVTNSISINNQKYTIKGMDKTIEQDILMRYPVNIDNAAQVEKIEIKNTYIDVALGLKYNFKPTKNGRSYFVNPSFSWLLYLPQEFEYSVSQASDLVSTRNRYIAYFGSFNLSIGMERQISENQIVQFSIWGEQSLIPLGQESQYINMAGLRASYLFGK